MSTCLSRYIPTVCFNVHCYFVAWCYVRVSVLNRCWTKQCWDVLPAENTFPRTQLFFLTSATLSLVMAVLQLGNLPVWWQMMLAKEVLETAELQRHSLIGISVIHTSECIAVLEQNFAWYKLWAKWSLSKLILKEVWVNSQLPQSSP